MRRNRLLALGLAATTALGAAAAIPALAHGPGDGRGYEAHGMDGHGERMEMMRGMHGHGLGAMHGMMGGRSGAMTGGMGPMGDMMDAFDADEDGSVTPEELRAGLESRLGEYDADGNGTLSIDEFEALHSAMIREHMVDRFQFLDNDGDGQITAEEIAAPADHMERMLEMRERMMPSGASETSEHAPGMMQDMEPGDMNGMMQDDADE